MRLAIFTLLLLTFSMGSLADLAHASAQDHACTHHQMEQDSNTDKEHCDSDENHSQCDDCCCIHSHSMATSTFQTKKLLKVDKQEVIESADQHYSAELPGLKRPPRI